MEHPISVESESSSSDLDTPSCRLLQIWCLQTLKKKAKRWDRRNRKQTNKQNTFSQNTPILDYNSLSYIKVKVKLVTPLTVNGNWTEWVPRHPQKIVYFRLQPNKVAFFYPTWTSSVSRDWLESVWVSMATTLASPDWACCPYHPQQVSGVGKNCQSNILNVGGNRLHLLLLRLIII